MDNGNRNRIEHGGSGSAIEYEADEAIEFEHETEKGGEVELEQFWLQKSFSKAFNIKAGHIVVPFGLTNAHHEPLNFFTVYRPEGENTIFTLYLASNRNLFLGDVLATSAMKHK